MKWRTAAMTAFFVVYLFAMYAFFGPSISLSGLASPGLQAQDRDTRDMDEGLASSSSSSSSSSSAPSHHDVVPAGIKPVINQTSVEKWVEILKHEPQEIVKVEIWSKAAIGEYFFEHIMGSDIVKKLGGIWSYGEARCGPIRFALRTGPGVLPSKVPQNTENVILVLNGREEEKQAHAKEWLDYLPRLKQLQNVGVIMLGEESCKNEWFRHYLDGDQYKIKFAFLVYGGKDWVDNKRVFQWPLGVATYRHFPRDIDLLDAFAPDESHGPGRNGRRKYLCNLQATIYPGSTREELMKIVKANKLQEVCDIRARKEWLPEEPDPEGYRTVLLDSDYTLAPAGFNTECYRWYEAAACGSIPIVEDVVHPATCGLDPLALLKSEGAPFIYVKDWRELPDVLRRERLRSPEEIVAHRRRLVTWYAAFKRNMAKKVCSVLMKTFFDKEIDVF